MLHVRKMYSVSDFFGDFGGILEFLILIFGILMYPINEHVFYSSEIPRLYSYKKELDSKRN